MFSRSYNDTTSECLKIFHGLLELKAKCGLFSHFLDHVIDFYYTTYGIQLYKQTFFENCQS